MYFSASSSEGLGGTSRALLLHLAVLDWSFSHGLVEHAREVLGRVKARELRDPSCRKVGRGEKVPRSLHPEPLHVERKSHFLAGLPQLREVVDREACDARNVRNAQGLGVMLMDVLDRTLEAPIVARLEW